MKKLLLLVALLCVAGVKISHDCHVPVLIHKVAPIPAPQVTKNGNTYHIKCGPTQITAVLENVLAQNENMRGREIVQMPGEYVVVLEYKN